MIPYSCDLLCPEVNSVTKAQVQANCFVQYEYFCLDFSLCIVEFQLPNNEMLGQQPRRVESTVKEENIFAQSRDVCVALWKRRGGYCYM